jgi:TolB-like protein
MTVRESIPLSESAVREQLERILASAHFSAAEGASRLLRFLVEAAFADRAQPLKEYTIAIEVLGRDPSFDSKINPAVRVEASRLRQRLERYYLTVGREDPVLIELPRGTYMPTFLPQADVLHLSEHVAEVREGVGAGTAVSPIALKPTRGPTIAVLPLDNLGDAEDATFADGVTVEIVAALSRFRELHVLGRSTMARHRDVRDAPTLHRELGADYVLEGNVRKADDRLRVHAELVSGATGVVLWAEGYERDYNCDEIFRIQDDIARQVVAAVAQPHGVIARPQTELAMRKPPGRLDAYDCLLLFYGYAFDPSPDRHRKVRAALEAEVKLEPGVSSLWSALSMVHNDTWRFGFNAEDGRASARDAALAAARKAVNLDPLNALGYHALFLAQFARRDLKAFREAANRAVELNPNNPDILSDYGVHLTFCGEWTLGLLFLKLALSLNPEPPDWYWFPFFIWHFDRGEYDEALDMALRSQTEQFFWTHGMHAMAYTGLGMRNEAAKAVSRLLEVYPEFQDHAREELGRWLDPERAERTLGWLREAGVPIPAAELAMGSATDGSVRSRGPGKSSP